MRTALLAVVSLLVLAPAVAAGGWATVGVSPLPAGTEAGGTWTPTLTILQHGRTPLEHVQPSITIRDAASGETHTVAATGGKGGLYSASVTFPSAGTWTVAVDDGFSRVHTFAPVEIRAGAGAGAAPRSLGWLLGGSLALALALALLLVAGGRPQRGAAKVSPATG